MQRTGLHECLAFPARTLRSCLTEPLPTAFAAADTDIATCVSPQQDPEWTAEKELCMRRGVEYRPPAGADRVVDEGHMADEAAAVRPGDRCQVDPGAKRGTVR